MIRHSIILVLAVVILVSCKKAEEKSSVQQQDKVHVTFDKKLLDGVWAENQEDNALFYIEDDSIYYTDSQDKPYALEFRGSYFSVHYDDYISKAELLKLTQDSLVYKSSTNIIKLFRKADQVKESKVETRETSSLDSNKKCDIEKVAVLKQQLPNASKESILSFLSTISTDCKNNAEFGQFSNEVLFEVLQAMPMEVLMIIGKENVEKDKIYQMLESPVSDAVNLSELIDSINKLELQSIEKSEFWEALKRALEKYN